jgi:hypothetical protein
MTSQINPNNINGAYPVAGQDNNSQGFRDNFTNTSTNFQYAAQEITDLQNKVVLKAALTGTSLNNDMLNSALTNALIADFAATRVALGNLSGTVPIDYSAGHIYTVGTSAPISLSFSNWPVAGQYGFLSVEITVNSTADTVTFPAAVSVNVQGIRGLNYDTNSITFTSTGVYTFNFSTTDGGTTVTINESNNLLVPFNNSGETLASGAASIAVTTTSFTSATTATLANGVPGQMKIFEQTVAGPTVITVANAGWKASGSGTITLTAIGSACTLRFNRTLSKWVCVGNNGAVFA